MANPVGLWAALCMEFRRAIWASIRTDAPCWIVQRRGFRYIRPGPFRGLGGTLTGGFIEEHSGRSRGVQRFYRRGHGDADTGVCQALDLFRQALAFVADEKRDGAAP